MYNIILLNKCNLRCSYCFAEDYMHAPEGEKNDDIMSEEVFDLCLDLLQRSHADHASLLGGEPTLHPQFKKFWSKAKQRQLLFSLKSNALWDEGLQEFFNAESDPLYRYHLNINGPERLTSNQWKIVSRNVKTLKGQRSLQLNIEKPDFEWQWIVDMAMDSGINQIIWSLAAPIHSESSPRNGFASYSSFRVEQNPRLYSFLKAAGQKGIKTLGYHGPTPCLLTQDQLEEVRSLGGELDGRCIPVYDIFPDKTIHYCFPLKDFIHPPKIDEVEDMAEVAGAFMRELAPLRTFSFPWEECIECPEALAGRCHGGCLSQKKMKGLHKDEALNSFYQMVPILNPNALLNTIEGVLQLGSTTFQLPPEDLAILRSVDSKRDLEAIFQLASPKFTSKKESIKRDHFFIAVSDLTGAEIIHYRPQQTLLALR